MASWSPPAPAHGPGPACHPSFCSRGRADRQSSRGVSAAWKGLAWPSAGGHEQGRPSQGPVRNRVRRRAAASTAHGGHARTPRMQTRGRGGGKAGAAARGASWAPLPAPSPGFDFQLHPPSGLGGANAAASCPHRHSSSWVPSHLSLPVTVTQPGDVGEPCSGSHLLMARVASGAAGHLPHPIPEPRSTHL